MKTYLWGAGQFGKKITRNCMPFFAQSEYELAGYIDTNHGSDEIHSYTVYSPDVLLKEKNVAVIIAIKNESASDEVQDIIADRYSENVAKVITAEHFMELLRKHIGITPGRYHADLFSQGSVIEYMKGVPFVFFADEIVPEKAYEANVNFDWSYTDVDIPFYHKQIRYTSVIDLSKSMEDILAKMDRNCRRYDRVIRGRGDAVTNWNPDREYCSSVISSTYLEKNVAIWDQSWRKIDPVDVEYVMVSCGDDVIVLSFYRDTEHRTVVERTIGYDYQGEDISKSIKGKVSRYAVLEAIRHYKEAGFLYFDMGGIGFESQYLDNGEPIEAIRGIVNYKIDFGGEKRIVYRYDRMWE